MAHGNAVFVGPLGQLAVGGPRPTMTLSADVLDAHVEFRRWEFLTPLWLSSGPVTEVTEAEASVTVRVGDREVVGRGAICLAHLWAWPQPPGSGSDKDGAMRGLCEAIARRLPALCGDEPSHPLQLGLRLHDAVRGMKPDEMPALARLVCLSPFDAAIHDAAGLALGRPALSLYDEQVPVPDADPFFPEGGTIQAIRRMLRAPAKRLDAWLTIGVDECDPEVLEPWIRRSGYQCFKLKLSGRDTAADVARTVRLHRLVTDLGVSDPRIATDSNGGNPDAASVSDYLRLLQENHPAVFDAITYLEQPTSPDIAAAPQDWRRVASLKPVVLDEGLIDLPTLIEARRQAWSGIAIKTCKGQSMALVAAAWAHQQKMVIVMQDLTNPGLAAIHSALLAAYLPVINGLELNSPQFIPQANEAWLPRLAGLFNPVEGVHSVPSPSPPGLGTGL